MLDWIKLVLAACALAACANKGAIHAQRPTATTKPPRIDAIMDLGALPVMEAEGLDTSASDGRFTPGEWMAVFGRCLCDTRSEVFVGDAQIEVAECLDNGILVRMPRRAAPGKATQLRIRTPVGEAAADLWPQSYVIVSDTAAGEIRFFRTAGKPDSEAYFDPECDAVAMPRIRFHALSPSGGLLYAVAAGKGTGRGVPVAQELLVVHVGAKDHPLEIGAVSFTAASPPIALELDVAHSRLVLATRDALLVFDVRDERHPRQVVDLSLVHPSLSEVGYVDMALVEDGDMVVLLDGMANRLTLAALTETPRMVSHLEVVDGPLPRLIDIIADDRDRALFHVVEGPNLRLAKSVFHKFAPRLADALNAGSETSASRILTFRVTGEDLSEVRTVPLPGRAVPMHLCWGADGDLNVSMVDFDVMKLSLPDSVGSGIRLIVDTLRDAAQVGTVLRVDRDGNVQRLAEGAVLFLTLAGIHRSPEILSLVMRIGVRRFPPSVGVKLSLDVLDQSGRRTGEQLLRNLSWTFLIPPYVTPNVSFQ